MIKLTKRKGFNFFRSYFDVYNELENDADKVAFIDALLDRQFMGVKPVNLKGMAKFAYISQTNSIDSQVKGYEDKTGNILHPTVGLILPPPVGVITNPAIQVEVEEKVKEKVKDLPLPLDNDFDLFWNKYNKKIDSKKCKDKFKKLSKIQVETILKVVDSYVAATSDVQYRKNPLTWLNGECWKDVEVNTFLPTKDKPFGKSNQL